MGVLTDPQEGSSRPSQLMIKHHIVLESLLYLCGLCWLFLLPYEQVHSPSYFSENSLLPGLVKGSFVEDSLAKTLLASLNNEITGHPGQVPYPWLLAQFRQIGLDAYTHNFSLKYPLTDGITYQGQNVYGILRAPRGSSTEAIVLSAPFRASDSAYPSTAPGIALILALAKFCRRQKYWAKDLIFLFTEHEQLGVQAWLEAYHRTSSGRHGVLEHGDMVGRGGAIQNGAYDTISCSDHVISVQAAVNLELHSDRISHIDVKIEGLNGQLPNLDLVNLVHMLCGKEGVRHSVHNRANLVEYASGLRAYNRWWFSFSTMMAMITTQATGVPNGNHGLYHRFGIEAITLQGFEKQDRGSPATFYQVGRVLEGILRSLNNLLERFHQSYFFYLLSATDRYISIGVYMPAVGLMASTLLLRALVVWRKMQLPFQESEKDKLIRANEISSSFAPVGVTLLGVHVMGVLLMRVPEWSSHYIFLIPMQVSAETAVGIGLFTFGFLSFFTPFLTTRKKDNISLLYVAALIELATVLLAIAMHNFSLAYILAAIYVPFSVFANSRHLRFLWTFCWFLLQPFMLVTLIILMVTAVNFSDESIPLKALFASIDAMVFSYIDYVVYGNWMLSVIAAFLFPSWLLFWIVVLKHD